jgi:hypothetical protein
MFHTDYNVNQVDPQLFYSQKERTLAVVDNPFYELLPVEKFPGPLRYQPEISIADLAKPYPHYGDIIITDGFKGGAMKYRALQVKVQKTYSHGISLLIGYSYNVEKDERFFDAIATYNREYSLQNANSYRHRLTGASTWDLPFGKGRPFLSSTPRLVDAVLGGWRISSVVFWRSGNLLGFGPMVWNGTDPRIDNPTPDRWFNTTVFRRLPNYTPRTNPWNFSGLTGPGVLNVNGSLAKDFSITEKLRAQIKADAFNVLNNMSWGDPTMNVDSSTFGQITNQAPLTFGRRVQLGVRLEF